MLRKRSYDPVCNSIYGALEKPKSSWDKIIFESAVANCYASLGMGQFKSLLAVMCIVCKRLWMSGRLRRAILTKTFLWNRVSRIWE